MTPRTKTIKKTKTTRTTENVTDRSTAMDSMYEALARERMSDARERAAAYRVSRHVSAARRWARLERMAASAHARHVRRAEAVRETR